MAFRRYRFRLFFNNNTSAPSCAATHLLSSVVVSPNAFRCFLREDDGFASAITSRGGYRIKNGNVCRSRREEWYTESMWIPNHRLILQKVNGDNLLNYVGPVIPLTSSLDSVARPMTLTFRRFPETTVFSDPQPLRLHLMRFWSTSPTQSQSVQLSFCPTRTTRARTVPTTKYISRSTWLLWLFVTKTEQLWYSTSFLAQETEGSSNSRNWKRCPDYLRFQRMKTKGAK